MERPRPAAGLEVPSAADLTPGKLSGVRRPVERDGLRGNFRLESVGPDPLSYALSARRDISNLIASPSVEVVAEVLG